jgi:hypothetical protein
MEVASSTDAYRGEERKMLRRLTAVLVLLILARATMAIETPDYDVLSTNDDFEVRRYAEYIVAEVDIDGGMRDAGNSAFRILAGYIFGNNVAGEKMRMTAPVEASAGGEGVRMNMTAPVESQPGAGDATTYAFVMERKYTLETLPKPEDPRIRIVVRPARTMAVRRYSGSWSEANYLEHRTALYEAIGAAGLEPTGPPVWARYNAPITPWFLRRNEVMVEVSWPPAAARGQDD